MTRLRPRTPSTPVSVNEESSRLTRSYRKDTEEKSTPRTPRRGALKELNTEERPLTRSASKTPREDVKSTPKRTPARAKPEPMRHQVLKMRVRKSLIAKARQEMLPESSESESSSDDSGSEADLPVSQETPGRRSHRIAGETVDLKDVVLGSKRTAPSTPVTAPRPLKLRVRKSMVARGRQMAKDHSDEEDSCSEAEEVVEVKSARKEKVAVQPLTGRETEFKAIDEWIQTAIAKSQPLAVYIGGSPGTGKTATLRLVLKKWDAKAASVIVNCVSIKTQRDLIEAVFASEMVSERPTLNNFQQYLETSAKPLILVLDEIDHLGTNTNSLLYTAFKWPQELTSRLVMIGIANSIDLTERLLPKLKLSHPPKSLVFAPYTKDTIVRILEKKMNDDDTKLDAKAVELCARKVAAMSGDLRKALHVVNATKGAMTSESATGGCREVLGVLSSVYSSPLARARLPLQPRLLLAVCLCMSGNKKTNLTMSSLFSAYNKACEAVRVPPLENDDLSAAFQTLESQSFVSVTPNGHIRLQVDSSTARNAISDNAMIDQIGVLYL